MDIVPRSEWGARPPRSRFLIPTPTPKLYLHHTASPTGGPARVRAIQNFHMDSRGWSDIAYSFLVSAAGIVYEGRGAGVAGGHTAGQNTVSHAICAMGDYDTTIPPQKMLDVIRQLLVHGHGEGWWPDRITGGHRDAPGAATSCPGQKLYVLIPELNTPGDDMPTAREIADEVWLKTTIPNVEASGQRTHMSDAVKRIWQAALDDGSLTLPPAQIEAIATSVAGKVSGAVAEAVADMLAERLRD